MSTATERITFKLPAAFDPSSARHLEKLTAKVIEMHGEGWEIESINAGQAVATRRAAITQIGDVTDGRSMTVGLVRSVKASDGEKMAARLADLHPGYHMTEFEPFLGKAVMTKLSDDELRCRGAVSVALGVKPWDVQVAKRRGGGFHLGLPKTYVPSKHDDKLDEVATTVVGSPGWYLKTNARALTSEMIPSEPPTFPGAIPTPMPVKPVKFDHTDKSTYQIPLGWVLPEPGQKQSEEFCLDMNAGAHTQVGGVSGGGKLFPLDDRIPVPISDRFPTGWARNRDLVAGDRAFSADGSITEITGFSEVTEEAVYEVVFEDGQVEQCGPRHLWPISVASARKAHQKLGDRPVDIWRGPKMKRMAEAVQQRRDRVPHGAVGTLRDIALWAHLEPSRVTGMGLKIEHLGVKVPRPVTAGVFDTEQLISSLETTPATICGRRLSATTVRARGVRGQLSLTQLSRAIAGPKAGRVDEVRLSSLLASRGISPVGVAEPELVTMYPVNEVLGMIVTRLHLEARMTPGDTIPELTQVVDTQTLEKMIGARPAVQVAESIQTPKVRLPLDPYTLGAWLSLATSTDADTLVTTSEHVSETLAEAGFEVSLVPGTASIPRYRCTLEGLGEKVASIGVVTQARVGIPAPYLRAGHDQRLALLQGLVDAGARIGMDGQVTLLLQSAPTAASVLELVRSLGIKARQTTGTGGSPLVSFHTDLPVATASRKAARLPGAARQMPDEHRWNRVVAVRRTTRTVPMRCIAVKHPSHLYLTGGFIPTHNTVTINCYIAQWLSRGAELVIIDLPSKSADFEWCKKYVRPGGWGCAGPEQAAVAIDLVMKEGERRAKILKKHGVNDWKLLPKGQGFTPLIVVVDELTGLYALEKVPKTSKNSPPKLFEIAEEAERINFAKELLQKGIKRSAAELRFTGVFILIATQIASTATGIDTALRTNLHHRMLLGTKTTDNNRRLIFSDIERVPLVPENIRADGAASRGVGTAEPEGAEPAVFKSYFATVAQYAEWLDSLGVPVPGSPEPSKAQIADLMGEEDYSDRESEREAMIERRKSMPDPVVGLTGTGTDWDGQPLKGAALAASQSAALAALKKKQDAERAEATG